MKRRDFLTTSLAVSAAAALAPLPLSAAEKSAAGRGYYELRAYRLKPGGDVAPLSRYLEKAVIPALNQRGVRNVGTDPVCAADCNSFVEFQHRKDRNASR